MTSDHVLLIGIDDYRDAPLGGCVNDIDAVQRILLGPRLGIAADRIRRLASPAPGSTHDSGVAEQPATLANIAGALEQLASDRVQPGDRVFIYYAGHGTRVAVGNRGRVFHREALVAADHDPARPGSGMLYDFDLNRLLTQIVDRTTRITFVLDCCYSGSVTRSALELSSANSFAAGEPRDRCIERAAGHVVPSPSIDVPAGPVRLASVRECQVIAACQSHERAREETGPGGVRHGLLTRAFVEALDATTGASLRSLSWSRIWQRMCAAVLRRNPCQHLGMTSSAGRAVFSGPPCDADAGIPVTRIGNGFQIDAGTLAGVENGAMLAVYGTRPARFPALDSAEDRRHRVGRLSVTTADRATAQATIDGPPFELPPGARARLVRPGNAARLRCAVVPRHRSLEAALRGSPFLELVDTDDAPEVRLEQSGAQWFVTDDVHGVPGRRPVLVALAPAQLYRARAVLEHYRTYSMPVRMVRRATDLDGALELAVRVVPKNRSISTREAQTGDFPEAELRDVAVYRLHKGDHVCFELRNRSPYPLRVTLLDAAASGRVQRIGDETIAPDSYHMMWSNGNLNAPTVMTLIEGARHGVDRLVAIGRTHVQHDLGHLCSEQTFKQLLGVRRGDDRPMHGASRANPSALPPEHWIATQVLVELRLPPTCI